MGKGEIVPFQKTYVADREKQWLVWQRVERQLKLGMVLQVGGQHGLSNSGPQSTSCFLTAFGTPIFVTFSSAI